MAKKSPAIKPAKLISPAGAEKGNAPDPMKSYFQGLINQGKQKAADATSTKRTGSYTPNFMKKGGK